MTHQVRDRPVIFSAPMVRVILAGRKTMTRRLATSPLRKCEPGDRLWVRESIWQASRYPGTLPSGEPEPLSWCYGRLARYAADGDPPNSGNRTYPEGLRNGAFAAPDPYARWIRRPSIHMPRWASRITLEVTGVRVERLQDISYEDCRDEGTTCPIHGDVSHVGCMGLRRGFRSLWESLHGPDAWDANPEVVAVSFRKVGDA